jgi:hypothetical protein
MYELFYETFLYIYIFLKLVTKKSIIYWLKKKLVYLQNMIIRNTAGSYMRKYPHFKTYNTKLY